MQRTLGAVGSEDRVVIWLFEKGLAGCQPKPGLQGSLGAARGLVQRPLQLFTGEKTMTETRVKEMHGDEKKLKGGFHQ